MQEAFERYAAQASVVLESIQGLSRDDLLARPVSGTWSIQQIVIHLLDSDLVGIERMKRVIAMDRPLLLSFDENLFAARLGYEGLDAFAAADAFRLNRILFTQVLKQQAPEVFERMGVHSETGLKSLRDLIVGFTNHVEG